MPLRSGKNYLISHRCPECNKFYSHEHFGYKCSVCSGNSPELPRIEPTPELLEWVKKNTVDSSKPAGNSFLTQLKRMDNTRLFIVLRGLRRQGRLLLKSEDALLLLEDQNNVTRGHVVASAVADWWNIKTRYVGGSWFGYLVCYYGNFDSKYPPRQLPPRYPNEMLSCTNTSHLLQH
jgi:hypothetical protein